MKTKIKPIKAYIVIWDGSKKINWDNIDQIVETKEEAENIVDISGDLEAQHNTPYKTFIPVLISPIKSIKK